MTEKPKIPGTDEAWESGLLGRDEKYARVADDFDEAAIDEALGLSPRRAPPPKDEQA